MIGDTESGALFDETRKWRYTLWRRFKPGCPVSRMCAFIGLNPSIADEHENDRTVSRCIEFSRDWGFDGLVMLNLFSWCATDPEDMFRAADPVGPRGNEVLQTVPRQVGRVVCAWGVNACDKRLGPHVMRPLLVRGWLTGLPDVCLLQRTKSGHPQHPLYIKRTTVPLPFF